jgi:hypothetical protein
VSISHLRVLDGWLCLGLTRSENLPGRGQGAVGSAQLPRSTNP